MYTFQIKQTKSNITLNREILDSKKLEIETDIVLLKCLENQLERIKDSKKVHL